MSLIHKIDSASPGVLVLFFKGRMLNDDQFIEINTTLENNVNTHKFIFDLKELEHINSSGLNTLLKSFTKIRNNGGELVLINLNSQVENIFNISKLQSIFNICATTREALNFLNAQEA